MIVLNGGSSSGKSTLVRHLQDLLPDPWLASGCDVFVDALPARLRADDTEGDGTGDARPATDAGHAGDGAGIVFGEDGGVSVGAEFLALEAAWRAGLVATARAGARIVVDDVFLSGAASQDRWRTALGDLPVLWVGVRCAADVAEGRERARGDRVSGMARRQAESVHVGVEYDLEVDTTRTGPLECARIVAARATGR
ncbi:chloramphenicol phosphotransferase [Streptomyces sp. NPDC097619]|uniref:chloramphenicol phosphotransferase CPT family protein n=1 Tax=Streptomyces sp. NPDC097619 TaxID=3157228 RepID=UPI003323CE76